MTSTRRRLSEASATARMVSGRLLRPRSAWPSIDIEAELGGDHDLVPHRCERFADHFLVGEGAIDLGGVEEGDAAIVSLADQT
jgi:hypothetical protein